MQSRDKSTAQLIMKKSSMSLKISVSMLVVSLLVISIMSIIYMKQYYQMDKDFISNVAVHTIKLEQIKDDLEQTQRGVMAEDVGHIEGVIKAYKEKVEYKIMPSETNATGIYINDGDTSVELISVEKDKSFLLGGDVELKDNVLYTHEDTESSITLQCDKVDLENCSSYGKVEINMRVEQGVSERSPLVLMGMSVSGDHKAYFVTNNTFKSIMSQMLGNTNNNASMQGNIIDSAGVYLYLEDVTQVDKISKYLEDNGIYNTCTFDAFEDMGDSLGVTRAIFAVVEIIILLLGIVQIYLAFNAFYKVQQKDIGILLYHGYTKDRVYNMYAYNLSKIFKIIAVVVGLTTIVIGSIVLGCKYMVTSLVIAFILVGIILMIMLLIRIGVIKQYVKKDILTLIKSSKEFQ